MEDIVGSSRITVCTDHLGAIERTVWKRKRGVARMQQECISGGRYFSRWLSTSAIRYAIRSRAWPTYISVPGKLHYRQPCFLPCYRTLRYSSAVCQDGHCMRETEVASVCARHKYAIIITKHAIFIFLREYLITSSAHRQRLNIVLKKAHN